LKLNIFDVRTLCRCLLLFVLLAVCLTGSLAQGISSYEKQRGQMMLDQAKNDIKSNYFDPSFHGQDIEATFNLNPQITQFSHLGKNGFASRVLSHSHRALARWSAPA